MSEPEAEKRPREEAPEASSTDAASDDLPESKKTRTEAEPAVATQPVPALGAQETDALAKLLAFYFSDANLRRDKFLIAEQAKTADGWVPIRVLLSFNKVKQVSAFVGVAEKGALDLDINKSSPQNVQAIYVPTLIAINLVYMSIFIVTQTSHCLAIIRSLRKCRMWQPQQPPKHTDARTCSHCPLLVKQCDVQGECSM